MSSFYDRAAAMAFAGEFWNRPCRSDTQPFALGMDGGRGRALLVRRLARGQRLSGLPLHDLGQGARDAALDRPQRRRSPADAEAGADAGGSGRAKAAGARLGNGDGRDARHRAGLPARHRGDEDLTAFNAACVVALARGRPNGEVQRTVTVLLDWARENHREWFYRFDSPAPSAAKAMRPAALESQPVTDAGPPPPRHSPTF